MKKLVVSALAAIALAAVATSCTTVTPGIGFGGASAVNPYSSIQKTGEATGLLLFGQLPLLTADYSVSTAAKNGGITKIHTVDSRRKSILGIVVWKTTIVTGE